VKHNLRQERTLFFLFLGACLVALLAALPLVTAQQSIHDGTKVTTDGTRTEEVQKPQSAAAGGSALYPSFEEADRNGDGFVDKSEAGVVPGLSANFERADASRDGRLDPQEFAKGLEILQVRR
jgi:hypothetical protein